MNVDIGSISVTDDLREALIDKVELLVTGSSTLQMQLKLGKDSENITMDVEASSYTFSVIMYPQCPYPGRRDLYHPQILASFGTCTF